MIQSSAPVAGQDISGLPERDRVSAKRVAQFMTTQYRNGLVLRRRHAISWIMIRSFLRGIHYFTVTGNGAWIPIPLKPGTIRSVVPILEPNYVHVLGFFNANALGVTAIPLASNEQPFYKAARAEGILNEWIKEAKVSAIYDQANQILLTEGTVGYHRYADKFRQQVFLRALPGSELFPIPYDAKTPDELHGLMHVAPVTRQWLELQDKLIGAKENKLPMMSLRAKQRGSGMTLDTPTMGSSESGGKFDGAIVSTIWMRPTEDFPNGQYLFMVEDELFRYAADESVKEIMPDGEIPVEIVYYAKNPTSFWANSFCQTLISSQFTINRQMTDAERNTRENRPLTMIDTRAVSVTDIQSQHSSLVGFDSSYFSSSGSPPLYHVPMRPLGKDVYALLGLSRQFGDSSAGLRSGIPFGQQEGRTESGPATSLLSQNAMASFTSPMARTAEALRRTYEAVLDMIPSVWPENKVIRVVGRDNIGKEIALRKEQIPSSKDVIIQPRPLLPGGTQALASVLFQMKQMPGEDGKPGTAVTNGEFYTSLQKMNLLPPGLNTEDMAESRIQTRVNLLIGDGQKPQIQPSDGKNPNDRLRMEDHKLSVRLLKNAILDDSYLSYGEPVQKALLAQLQFHMQNTFNSGQGPNAFDDDVDKQEQIQLENFLAAAEADLDTDEGSFLSLGEPVLG